MRFSSHHPFLNPCQSRNICPLQFSEVKVIARFWLQIVILLCMRGIVSNPHGIQFCHRSA